MFIVLCHILGRILYQINLFIIILFCIMTIINDRLKEIEYLLDKIDYDKIRQMEVIETKYNITREMLRQERTLLKSISEEIATSN